MTRRIGLKPLASLCRRVGTAHAAGVDARTIWQRESERGSVTQRSKLKQVSQAINKGTTFAESLSATDGYFPQLVCEIVDVGERTGKVDEAFHRLARHYEHLRTVRTAFLAGISWPMIQLVIAVLVIGGVIGFMGFVPQEDSIDLIGLHLVGTRGMLIYFSVVGAIVAAVWLAIWMRGTFLATLMGACMRLPVVGRWLQLMGTSRMAWSLGMAVDSGMDIKQCVQIALRSTQNRYFTQHATKVNQYISRGQQMHEAFSATGAFSQDFLDAVEIGEQTGRFAESMDVLAKQYEGQGKVAMQAVAVAAGVGVWMLVAMVIIYFIFRIAMSYVQLLEGFM